jgi:DHA1 family multidrug/chloramphenicol efflux transport protein-like MFS transporter
MALMASVSLLAPLLGPILGALIVTFFSWRVIFGVIAVLATLGLYGLWRYMPETVRRIAAPGQPTMLVTQPFRFGKLVRDYLPVLSNRQIILGSMALGCACIPLMNWIALAPVILIERHHETPLTYGWWQLPVFGAMIAGHITMARLADRWPLERLMRAGLAIMVLGILLTYPGYWLEHGFTGTVWGFAVYAYGTGPFYVSIYRRALFASESAKGTVAAAINTIFMLLMVIGVELSKTVYIQYGEVPLLGASTLAILLALAAALSFAQHMQITRPEAKTTPFDAATINTRLP